MLNAPVELTVIFLQIPKLKQSVPQKGGRGSLPCVCWGVLLSLWGDAAGEGIGEKPLQSICFLLGFCRKWKKRHPAQNWPNKLPATETPCKILVWFLAAYFAAVSTQKPTRAWTFRMKQRKEGESQYFNVVFLFQASCPDRHKSQPTVNA